jgi:hypothetical protein
MPQKKIEEGREFPAAAFAYAPNADTPDTWKLRLWDANGKGLTREQVGRAAAAFSPGGFRGQRVKIPAADVGQVKSKIRGAYAKLDIPAAQVPRWVRESSGIELSEFQDLTEADVSGSVAQVIVIAPGFNRSQEHFYPQDALREALPLFEGVKMFADHATRSEQTQRPEGSITNWVATLRNPRLDESGRIVAEAHVHQPWLREMLANLKDAKALSSLGVSINAVAKVTRKTIDNVKTMVVETIKRVVSVDFVTEPGAGGHVVLVESNVLDDIEIGQLETTRPDIAEALRADNKEGVQKMDDQILELTEAQAATATKIADLEKQIESVTAQRDGFAKQIEEAAEAQAKADKIAKAKAAVEKAFAESDAFKALKNPTQTRLREKFADAESEEGIEEAIKAEAEYVASLTESTKVVGLGAETQGGDKTKTKEEITESHKQRYIREGKTEDQAQRMAEAFVR